MYLPTKAKRSSNVRASGLRPMACAGSLRLALGMRVILSFVQQQRFHRRPIYRTGLAFRPRFIERSVLIGIGGALGFHARLQAGAECPVQDGRSTSRSGEMGVHDESEAVQSLNAGRTWLHVEVEGRVRIGGRSQISHLGGAAGIDANESDHVAAGGSCESLNRLQNEGIRADVADVGG